MTRSSKLAMDPRFWPAFPRINRTSGPGPVLMSGRPVSLSSWPAARLDSDEVQRVQRDVMVQIRRVLESYNLNRLQSGLPPRPGY